MLIVSDFEDPGNETITLPNGNVYLFHRNLAIIDYFVQHSKQKDWRWLVITDDDTILGNNFIKLFTSVIYGKTH